MALAANASHFRCTGRFESSRIFHFCPFRDPFFFFLEEEAGEERCPFFGPQHSQTVFLGAEGPVKTVT